jgi:hypothetical protein
MKSRAQCKSNGWGVVVFENEHADDRVAYVVGPFNDYQKAIDWAQSNEEDYEITSIDLPEIAVQS